MYKILRIICCVISALLVAACVFVFVYLGIVWGISTIVAAATFFVLTILFKNLQQDQERAQEKRNAKLIGGEIKDEPAQNETEQPENNEENK